MKCGGAGDVHASRSSDHGCYSQQSSSQTAAGVTPGRRSNLPRARSGGPSLTATPAIAGAANGSSHHQLNRALPASPRKTALAR
jgi:hypothetical protein